jgi:hypothetical protein
MLLSPLKLAQRRGDMRCGCGDEGEEVGGWREVDDG